MRCIEERVTQRLATRWKSCIGQGSDVWSRIDSWEDQATHHGSAQVEDQHARQLGTKTNIRNSKLERKSKSHDSPWDKRSHVYRVLHLVGGVGWIIELGLGQQGELRQTWVDGVISPKEPSLSYLGQLVLPYGVFNKVQQRWVSHFGMSSDNKLTWVFLLGAMVIQTTSIGASHMCNLWAPNRFG